MSDARTRRHSLPSDFGSVTTAIRGVSRALPELRTKGKTIEEIYLGPCASTFQAAEQGRHEWLAKYFSEEKNSPQINSTNDNGDTPLMLASEEGHVEAVKVLINAGASVTAANHAGRTALHRACRRGHVIVAKQLMGRLPSSLRTKEVQRVDKYGFAALFLALAASETEKHKATIQYLLENGAELDGQHSVQGLRKDIGRSFVAVLAALKFKIFSKNDRNNRARLGADERHRMKAAGSWFFMERTTRALGNFARVLSRKRSYVPEHIPYSGTQEERDAISCIIEGKLYLTNFRGAGKVEELTELGVGSIIRVHTSDEGEKIKGFQYLDIVLEDDEHQADQLIVACIEACAWIHSQSKPVVVHCAAGISRSASVVLYYLMTRKNMSLREAFEDVYSKRPVIWPNQGFMRSLMVCEYRLFGKNSLTADEYQKWTELG